MTADFGGLRMKHLIKIIALISALCLVLGGLSGCGKQGAQAISYSEATADTTKIDSGVVAENKYFSMQWDKDRAAVIIYSKTDDRVWSTIPYEYYQNSAFGDDITGKEMMNSAVSITILKGEQQFEYHSSLASVAEGRFKAEKMDNGVSVTFYFDEVGDYLTVDYYLEGDGFKTRVDNKKIKSFWGNRIFKVVPAPFMCSRVNTEQGDKDSYFVIPSGSGALMYLDNRSDATARTYSAEVYGRDYTIDMYNEDANTSPISMPFFGFKDGASAVCAIIEGGAESCLINARAGDAQSGYSYINATYLVAGYNNIFTSTNYRMRYNWYAEQYLEPFVLAYYPLKDAQANYTGIAKRYQKYLIDEKGMQKSEDNSLLNVKLIGSYVEDDLLLGLPTTKDVPLTTYSEATEILKELNDISGGNLIANMYGYGKGGINSVQIAGGYELTGIVGKKQDLQKFVDYTKQASIKTFFNFDTILYYTSGAGFSTKKDSAISISGIPAPVYQFWYSTRSRLTKKEGGRVGTMVSRDKLADSTLKTVDTVDKYGISGIAYDTLGNMAYSDYKGSKNNKSFGKYPLKAYMGRDVAEIIGDVQSNSKTVMLDGAFAYAAAAADIITGCPTASDKNNSFDLDVPLYQIIFQGYKSNSASPINTAVNRRVQFLKAMETGSGLSFTLMANYTNDLRKQHMRGLNASLYEDNKDYIKDCVDESKAYLASVAGETISNHEYITNDVTKTVFSNGVTVYVNYGDKAYSIEEVGNVKANSFLVK